MDRPIYHLCIQSQWEDAKQSEKAYFPPTYQVDGHVTHASMEKENLLAASNLFYKQSTGKWVCLELDPNVLLYQLGITTLVEASRAVGDQAAETTTTTIRYPHIYGGIATTVPNLVTNVFPMKRDADGSFVSIPGLFE